MTIEFYKRKRAIQASRRDLLKGIPPKHRKKVAERLKIARVKVVNSKKLDHAGGRKYGGRGPTIKKGEIGYVFSWRQMNKDAGLQRIKKKRRR